MYDTSLWLGGKEYKSRLIVGTGKYPSFENMREAIEASGAELVYWGGLHTEGGLIVRQMRDQGVKAVLMGGDGITTDEFATVGGPGVEGTLMTYGPDPRNNPAAASASGSAGCDSPWSAADGSARSAPRAARSWCAAPACWRAPARDSAPGRAGPRRT